MPIRPHHLVLAAATALTLSACATPAQTPLNTTDVMYLSDLRRFDVEFTDEPRAIASGKQACDALGTGTAVPDAVKSLATEQGILLSDASVITRAAIGTYCPQHSGLLAIPGRP